MTYGVLRLGEAVTVMLEACLRRWAHEAEGEVSAPSTAVDKV
jgi:hypothetical protein